MDKTKHYMNLSKYIYIFGIITFFSCWVILKETSIAYWVALITLILSLIFHLMENRQKSKEIRAIHLSKTSSLLIIAILALILLKAFVL